MESRDWDVRDWGYGEWDIGSGEWGYGAMGEWDMGRGEWVLRCCCAGASVVPGFEQPCRPGHGGLGFAEWSECRGGCAVPLTGTG